MFLIWFLPLVLAGYYLLLRRTRTGQNLFLLAASLFFYAWGEGRFVLVMMGSILVNWALGLWVGRRRERGKSARLPVVLAVLSNLGLLFVFKYLVFTLSNLRALVHGGWTLPVIGLPIGISFFTFQALSYVLDVHRGRAWAQKSPFWVGLYIAFFPQLIAGPIVKYETVARELTDRKETWADFSSGTVRFLTGLGKKVLLANQFALIADTAFAADGLSAGLAWLGAVSYTLQIYFDFSGYSDMAIGLGRMFGFHFPENFNYPYIAASVTEFWRRWHISLSSWFRDYVYIPLGGNRVPPRRHIFNLFVVWLCTGAWHGANWTFLAWGMLYFLCLTAEKYTGLPRRVPKPLGHILTLLVVIFAWVMFRADSLAQGAAYWGAMVGLGTGTADSTALLLLKENAAFLLAGLLFSAPIVPWLGKRLRTGPALELLRALVLAAVLLLSLCYLVKGSYNPFIYFNF